MNEIQVLELSISHLEKSIAFNKMCGHKEAVKLEKTHLTYSKKRLKELKTR